MLNIQKGPKYFLFLNVNSCLPDWIYIEKKIIDLQASGITRAYFKFSVDYNSSGLYLRSDLMKDHILESMNTRSPLINIKKQNCPRHTYLPSKPAMLSKLLLKMFYPNFASTHTFFINSYVVIAYGWQEHSYEIKSPLSQCILHPYHYYLYVGAVSLSEC